MAKILVIEDDTQCRCLFREILENKGYEVREAWNGKEGMAAMRMSPADLIVTDIMMPEMDGFECIMAMQKEFPHVKVIAISAAMTNMYFDFLRLAKKLGVGRTLTKPFEVTALLHAVEEELSLQN